jgi:hypothetical protein
LSNPGTQIGQSKNGYCCLKEKYEKNNNGGVVFALYGSGDGDRKVVDGWYGGHVFPDFFDDLFYGGRV